MGYSLKARALLFGLLIECPFKEPDPQCPILDMRSDDLLETKRMALEDIDDDQMDSILKYHRFCCFRRDKCLVPK